ncbi:hypothetical protein ABZ557_17570 [Streptomyces sp. NPDC019645]|uniref:hypothetical protein n=1 Tax=Streptomyces sp. NPDC019645 TaxID=3154786 RepID=UPI0033DE3CDE
MNPTVVFPVDAESDGEDRVDTPLLDSATAAFHVIAEPGTAEAFDRDFGGLPHSTRQAAA